MTIRREDIQIHAELQSLIPPLTAEEYAQLEANLLQDGCRDALIIWQEEQTLLDGHHRKEICDRHDLLYACHEISLPSLDAAQLWMLRNQRGRRNYTPETIWYLRGKEHALVKKLGFKGNQYTSGAHQSDGKQLTAEDLAAEHKVGTATIERDAAYAKHIDLINTAVPGAKAAILARDTKIGRAEVKHLADITTHANPQTAKHVLGYLQEAPTPKAAKRIMHEVLKGRRDLDAIARENMGRELDDAETLEDAAAAVLTLEPEAPVVEDAPATWPQTASSGNPEWYTPPEVLVLAREVLGTIDVDPASCAQAQARVQARTFYTAQDDGLRQPWHGTVFCNPPYKLPEVARFIGKLFEEMEAGRTTAAILLVNSATETDWFQRAFARARAVCFPDGRLHFVSPTRPGSNPCQGQALLYFGPHRDMFCGVFAALGVSTLVVCAEAQDAPLPLAAAPPTPLVSTSGRPLRERNYCIVHVPLTTRGAAHGDPCSIHACGQTAPYHFWTHDPRPTGRVWVNRYSMCPTHAAQWCTAHQVDLAAIPTLAARAWGARRDAGDYDQVPWFRYVVPSPAPVVPQDTPITRSDAGSLIQAVWLMVQRLQPCTNAQVAQALGEPRNTIYAALKALVKQGTVRKDGQAYLVMEKESGA